LTKDSEIVPDRWLVWWREIVAVPQVLALLVVVNVAAYFGGLLFWYGGVMGDPATPVWAWPFIPDCPLFGLAGALGLLLVIANRRWSFAAQNHAQIVLLVSGALAAVGWLSTYLPGVSREWQAQAGMMALLAALLLLIGALFRRNPVWLLTLLAFGQIKYGLWTITAWSLFWQSTAQMLGAPLFSPESLLMTISHVGLAVQGILLLSYLRPTPTAAGVTILCFAASDFVDYRLGFFPAIPQELISLATVQWSTITFTVMGGALLLVWSLYRRPMRQAVFN
jgi:uncharacterized membrane protein YpjA